MKGAYRLEREINRIALINAPIDTKYQDSTSLFCPPLGLMSIKAYLEQKNEQFEVLLLDGMILTTKEIIRKMTEFHPDAVGVSIQLLSYKNALKICHEASHQSSFVFVGGHHATQMANKIITNRHSYINCVVCGDGEEAIYRICSGEKPEKVPGTVCWDSYKEKAYATKPNLCNLDILPNPYSAKNIDYTPYIKNLRKSSFSQKNGKYYRIYSHKGCRFRADGKRCVFCGRADEGYRFFSIERYFQYLDEMGVTSNDFVFDVGDDLSGNIIWLQEAVNHIHKESKTMPKIGIFGRGDEITYESASLLQHFGVVDVTMGVESGDNSVLISSGKEIDGSDIFYKAARTLFENGIGLTPSYVLGLPGENQRSLHNTIKHARILKDLSLSILGNPPGEIVANLLEPIPGSNAFKILEKEFPYKYLNEDKLELETMQRDYFCTVFSLDSAKYKLFRAEMGKAGKIINNLAAFADPQGWLNNEL